MKAAWEKYWPEFFGHFEKEASSRIGLPFAAFAICVKDKLKVGAREYGNESFFKSPFEILDELKEECVDLAGWALLQWANSDDVWVRRRAIQTAVYGLVVWKHLCDTGHYMDRPDPTNSTALRKAA